MFLSALILSLLCFASSLGPPYCSSLLNRTITLVENSSLEFGCRLDSEFTQCSLVNQLNASQNCSFDAHHPMTSINGNACIFGPRLSFIGNFTEKKCRFKINPVLTTGKSFLKYNFFLQVISYIYSFTNFKVF